METNNAISEFNLALRRSAERKWEELQELDKSAKIYRFDLENAKAFEVKPEELEEKIPGDRLEYFWIEYKKEEHKMKFAFFFKDVDTSSHNIHVVPGIFEEYEYSGKVPEKMPYADVDDGNAVIKNINKMRYRYDDQENGNGYPSFAEQDADGGWWCPTSEYKCISTKDYKIDKGIAIDGFVDYAEKFRDFEFIAASAISKYLKKEVNGLNIEESTVNTEKYKPVCWYNINGIDHSMYLTKPIFFSGYGFFTQYHCIDFGKEDDKKLKKTRDGRYVIKEIITNYPVVNTSSYYEKCKAIPLPDGSIFSIVKDRFKRFLSENND